MIKSEDSYVVLNCRMHMCVSLANKLAQFYSQFRREIQDREVMKYSRGLILVFRFDEEYFSLAQLQKGQQLYPGPRDRNMCSLETRSLDQR